MVYTQSWPLDHLSISFSGSNRETAVRWRPGWRRRTNRSRDNRGGWEHGVCRDAGLMSSGNHIKQSHKNVG